MKQNSGTASMRSQVSTTLAEAPQAGAPKGCEVQPAPPQQQLDMAAQCSATDAA